MMVSYIFINSVLNIYVLSALVFEAHNFTLKSWSGPGVVAYN